MTTIPQIIAAACKVSGLDRVDLRCDSEQPKYRRVRKAVQQVAVSRGHSYADVNAAMMRSDGARFGRVDDPELVAAIERELASQSPTPVRYVMSPSELVHLIEVSDEHRKAVALWCQERLRMRYDPTRFQAAERVGGEVRHD